MKKRAGKKERKDLFGEIYKGVTPAEKKKRRIP